MKDFYFDWDEKREKIIWIFFLSDFVIKNKYKNVSKITKTFANTARIKTFTSANVEATIPSRKQSDFAAEIDCN